MKTDKLLQLIQQKKFMRSGGALPLPKAQKGLRPLTSNVDKVINVAFITRNEKPIAPVPYVPDPVKRVMNPAFNFNVDFEPNRTKEAVVDQAGNPRYKYYNGDKVITEQEYKKLMEKRQGGSLPKHQWVTSQVLSQSGPTKAKANFVNSSSLGMATQNAANILNSIMSNKKNQPFVNFIDKRVIDPVVKGKTLGPKRKHSIEGVSRDELNKMVEQAKVVGVDPANLITIAGWESYMGQTDPNYVHDLYQTTPTIEGLDDTSARANMAAQALKRQLAIGQRLYPNEPFYKQMQAFEGYKPLYPDTEKHYYKHKNKAFYGIPVTKENPLRTNILFPYGKTIESFRDSVVIPTLEQYGIQYKEQGGLTKAQSGQTVSELWKQVTGSDWSKAKELGVTDGSYEKNMELRNALAKYVKTQPQPKKESQPAAPKYPWSPGGKYAHTDNKRLVVDKQRKPDVVPPSRINALVADAMNQNNPTPVDAIPNMNMKAVQDIANLNSKVVNRDDTKLAPKGSTRSKLQNALNYANEAVENTYGNPFMNPAAKWVYDAFVGAPAQSALNIANTVKGDRPIRNDQDIANLGWDALMVAPYVGEGLSLANKGRRALAFNAIDPVGYGAIEKLKRAPRTFMNNVFINPEGRAARIGEALDAHASPISQTNLGKRRLDAWNIYLQRPQQYNTFTKIGDNTYRMNNPIGYDKPERFESIMDDVDNLLENQGIGNKYVVERSKHPGFSFSQYRDDVEGGIMGGYRVDVSPTKSNNLKFRIADTWDIRPWEKRGNIYADPKIANNPAYQQALMKNYNKFLKDIEIGPIVGGKPFNIENNILYNPNKVKVIRRWEEGGELTSEKAIEILQDGTVNGKPLTAAQKRYFTFIANKNKRNG